MKKLNTLFFGTPEFSIPTLKSLHINPNIELLKIITMPDRPAGRGKKLVSPEVATYAKEHGLPLLQTKNINKEKEYLSLLEGDNNIDLIIVLAFAQFLGERILKLPKLGCFNIHTSLLPKYRGAAPIQYALLNGDKSTGVSIQKMVKKMDAGNICHSKTVQISENETGGSLYHKLKDQAGIEVNNFIENLMNENLTYIKQDESNVSFAPTLKKEDGKLNFLNEETFSIKNKVRALFPWPGTFCFLNSKRLKVTTVEILNNQDFKVSPGETNVSANMLLVGCVDGVVRLSKVQLEGKKECTDIELLNGLQNKYSEFKIT